MERNGKRRHGFILDQLAPATSIYVQAITVIRTMTEFNISTEYLHRMTTFKTAQILQPDPDFYSKLVESEL